MAERKRRIAAIVLLSLSFIIGVVYEGLQPKPANEPPATSQVAGVTTVNPAGYAPNNAIESLKQLPIKGRAPRTGYSREQFGGGWETAGACDIRNHILKRDLQNVITRSQTDCTVISGTLNDPYTGKRIEFKRGADTSTQVQIDHVVALSDAWQKGAQELTPILREAFANDPLNLLAVDGPANQNKGDSDAASWLPPNKGYRCRYVARQISVKIKYKLWLTSAERDAMQKVLNSCPDQVLPLVEQQ